MFFLTDSFIYIVEHHTFIPGHLLADVFIVVIIFVISGGHIECQGHITSASLIANIISVYFFLK